MSHTCTCIRHVTQHCSELSGGLYTCRCQSKSKSSEPQSQSSQPSAISATAIQHRQRHLQTLPIPSQSSAVSTESNLGHFILNFLVWFCETETVGGDSLGAAVGFDSEIVGSTTLGLEQQLPIAIVLAEMTTIFNVIDEGGAQVP